MSEPLDRAHDALKNSSFLGGLPDPVLDKLAERVHVKRYARGETIFERGDDGDSLMVILEGRVKIANITPDGREVVLNFLGRGDVNGEIAVLDGKERTAAAIALESTEVLVLYRRDLLPILAAEPQALLEIVAILCEKLRFTSAMVEDNTAPMAARVARGLLRLAEQHGRRTKTGVLIDLRLSQRDLGSYLGLSRENVNRQLAQFREAGHVRLDGAHILIADEAGLRVVTAEGKD